MIKISQVDLVSMSEPLISPFGFKGGYLSELWQIVASMVSDTGNTGIGLGLQSVLWSDPDIFASFQEKKGNKLMFDMTRYALNCIKGISFENPMELLDEILHEVHTYGKKITGNPDLKLTFTLNSLAVLDYAAWMLYCKENGISMFDGMLPETIRPALSFRNTSVANIPVIGYTVSGEEINGLLNDGCCILKIKIGSDPEKDGNTGKMLEWDKRRLSLIHSIAKDRWTPHTKTGRILYYLDANGRYDKKDTVLRFLDYADKIGAMVRILLFEEPFSDGCREDVHDIPVRLAVDESAHSDGDVRELISCGYSAVALKPFAKTMSMTLKILKTAFENSVACFCADLTVNPVLVDWNKNIAARIAPLPEMNMGILESNGAQNYLNWNRMKTYHPCFKSRWIDPVKGVFELDDDFYKKSGGIFESPSYYTALLQKSK